MGRVCLWVCILHPVVSRKCSGFQVCAGVRNPVGPVTVAAEGDRPRRGLLPLVSSSWDCTWGQAGRRETWWVSSGVGRGWEERPAQTGACSLVLFDGWLFSWPLLVTVSVAMMCSQGLQRHAGWQLPHMEWFHLALGDLKCVN